LADTFHGGAIRIHGRISRTDKDTATADAVSKSISIAGLNTEASRLIGIGICGAHFDALSSVVSGIAITFDWTT